MVRRIGWMYGGVAVFCALLAGCNWGTGWQTATSTNTVAAYQRYLQRYPLGAHRAQARVRLQTLEQQAAWMAANDANTAQAYREYLARDPHAVHAATARVRLKALEEETAWKEAEASGTPASMREFLVRYPAGAHAALARQELTKLAYDYRLDLGAFRNVVAAEHRRVDLEIRYPDLAHGLIVVPPTPELRVARIVSEPMSRVDASRVCESLARKHLRCRVGMD